MVQNVAKDKFIIKLLNNNIYKINVFCSDSYRAITKVLNLEKISWYSYENKQSRPIKIVVKNLHHSWNSSEIIDNLQSQNFKVISAINKLQYKTKEPLDMFLISFDSTEDIKRIYELKTILNTVVKIEPPRASKWIPQCKSCQGYNHTKNYCSKPARCVKCAGPHKTEECTKPLKEKPKCINCGEDHPANYRGCLVAKELQKLRNKNTQTKMPTHTSKMAQLKPENVKVHPQTTYASVAKNPSTKQASQKDNSKLLNDPLLQILEKLNQQEVFNKQLEKRLTKLENSLKSKKHD